MAKKAALALAVYKLRSTYLDSPEKPMAASGLCSQSGNMKIRLMVNVATHLIQRRGNGSF